MQVLIQRHTLLFVNPKPEDGGGASAQVTPQNYVQTIPDWVRDTPTYQVAANAGLIQEVQVVSQSEGKSKGKESDKDNGKESDKDDDEPKTTAQHSAPSHHTQQAHHQAPPPEPDKGNKTTTKK